MALNFDPIGGGQFKMAVKQIMEAEKQPLKQLEGRKANEEARLKLFQEFKSKFMGVDKAIEDISSFSKLREFKVDLGDGAALASVTIDKERAQPGSYQLEVRELAARTSVMSNGFEDPHEPALGLGFIVMDLDSGDRAEIFVDDQHSSLYDIASLINTNTELPIRAAVVRDAGETDLPWKLIMTAKKDGAENQIKFPEFYFMDGTRDFYIEDQKNAKNALISMDGFEMERESNDIIDFLPGINLHLKQARPGQPFSVNVTEDVQKIAGKMKGLVDQLNGILSFINAQNKVDENSNTRNTFAGDSGLQTIEYRLRNIMHEGFLGNDPEKDEARVLFLNQMGIEFDKSGQLAFKEDRFNKMMEKDYDAMAEAISGQFGFAYQLRQLIGGFTRAGSGTLAIREQGFRNRIKDIDQQIDSKTRRLDQREQALTDQFARLEASLSNLQRQQQYLSATLPGGGGGNLVQQLLG